MACPLLRQINALRETLGGRPLAYAAHGALHGSLMITGPLDHPVYTGNAYLAPPRGSAGVDVVQPSSATAAVAAAAADGAVAAYDRIPFTSGSAVFTLDTETQMFRLHALDASTVGGGRLSASGSMWVAPEAELDLRAVKMVLSGRSLPAAQMLQKYAQAAHVELPAAVLAVAEGSTSLEASMEGAHLSPNVNLKWETPEAGAAGSMSITRAASDFQLRAPQLEVGGRLQTSYPPYAQVRAARTQAEASAAARPVIEGCDVDLSLNGLELMTYLAPPRPQPAAAAQPLRLKLTGRAKFDGRLTSAPPDGASAPLPAPPSSFAGNLLLSGVRLNQLSLAPSLAGSLLASADGVQLHLRGRPDEACDLVLNLAPDAAAAAAAAAPSALLPEKPEKKKGGRRAGKGKKPADADAAEGAFEPASPERATFSLRRGQLRMDVRAGERWSAVEVANLKLDELELASLRGLLKSADFKLDFGRRRGRGAISVAGPRFSGLQGVALDAAALWDGGVVKLTKGVLEQFRSRYEVQAEYVLPNPEVGVAVLFAPSISLPLAHSRVLCWLGITSPLTPPFP